MSKYPLLQSGFVSIADDGLKRPDLIKDTTLAVALFRNHLLQDNLNFYSDTVSKLYHTWEANPDILKDFEFREKLLVTALSVFRTTSIYMWLKLQNDKANLNHFHATFIEETLAFVAGDERKIQPCQWISLMDVVKVDLDIRLEIDKWFDLETRPCHKNGHLPGLMTLFINKWVSVPNGFQDLLISLHVIFGNRAHVKDVVNKKSTILS